jgi:DNA helicase IV
VADDASEFDAHLDLVPASLAKGLEFDHVVLHDPVAIVAAEPNHATGLRRLYVCLTRAVTSLVVRHDGDLPPELGLDVEAVTGLVPSA